MFLFGKTESPNTCLYKIKKDNMLKLQNGEKMEIIEATTCAKNPELYYEMVADSPFGKTKCPIKFYKETFISHYYIFIRNRFV